MGASNNLLKAVAEYIKELNSYASNLENSKSDVVSEEDEQILEKYQLIHYNVGGAVTVVNQLKRFLQKEVDPEFVTLKNSELLELFKSAWFIESGKLQNQFKPLHRTFFNASYDPSCTLNYVVAQILTKLKEDNAQNGKVLVELFDVAANLLRTYSTFIIFGEDRPLSPLETNSYNSLETTFERLVELQTVKKNANLQNIDKLRREANEIFKQGNFGPSVAKYTEALLIDPLNYVLYANRAAAYTYLSSHQNAIEDLLKAVEIKPDFESAWARLGYCYLGRGKPVDSIKAYVKAIGLADGNKALPQYLSKLIQSLGFAKSRASQKGVATGEIKRLTEPVDSIIKNFNSNQNPPRSSPELNQRQNANQVPAENQPSISNGQSAFNFTNNDTLQSVLGNVFNSAPVASGSFSVTLDQNGEIVSANEVPLQASQTGTRDSPSTTTHPNSAEGSTAGNTEPSTRPPSNPLSSVFNSLNIPEVMRNALSTGAQVAVQHYINRNGNRTNDNNANNQTNGDSGSDQRSDLFETNNEDLDLD